MIVSRCIDCVFSDHWMRLLLRYSATEIYPFATKAARESKVSPLFTLCDARSLSLVKLMGIYCKNVG